MKFKVNTDFRINWALLLLHAAYGATSHILGVKAEAKVEAAVSPFEQIFAAVAEPALDAAAAKALGKAPPAVREAVGVGVAVAGGARLADEAPQIAEVLSSAVQGSSLPDAAKAGLGAVIGAAGGLAETTGAPVTVHIGGANSVGGSPDGAAGQGAEGAA